MQCCIKTIILEDVFVQLRKLVGKKISLEKKSHKNTSVFSTCWEVRGGKMWGLWQPSHDSHLSACCQPMRTRHGLSWFSPVKLNWITLQLQKAICVWAVTTEQLQMRACLSLSIPVLSTAEATSLLSQLACCVRCSALAALFLLSLV